MTYMPLLIHDSHTHTNTHTRTSAHTNANVHTRSQSDNRIHFHTLKYRFILYVHWRQTNVHASTGPHIDTSTDIDTDLPIYTGHLHVGDVLRVFSRSTDDWVDGELVEFVEDNCVRVKYVVGKYWCRKTINLHSEHLRVPSGISNVCKNSSSSERKEKNRDHIRKHGQNV